MKWLLASPSSDDLAHLLKAWRFWLLGSIIGALLGSALYWVASPPYRARATVNVDFNLEQAWPQDTDRQQFYYLEREARKLEEIAWSDSVMQTVAAQSHGATVNQLRDEVLQLSQPGEAGWHFYAEDRDPKQAAALASIWAQAFSEQAQKEIAAQNGPNSFIQAEVTQAANLPVERKTAMSMYMLAGAASFLAISALGVLFLHGLTPVVNKPRSGTQKSR